MAHLLRRCRELLGTARDREIPNRVRAILKDALTLWELRGKLVPET